MISEYVRIKNDKNKNMRKFAENIFLFLSFLIRTYSEIIG